MKFSWKANWEILLVLVIIAVGIVITTIAAIKNRDKHYVHLPDEIDQFGQHHTGRDPQTGGSTGMGAGMPTFNTDLSIQNPVDDGGGGGGLGTQQAAAPGTMITANNDNNNQLNAANDHHNDPTQPHHPQHHRNHLQQPTPNHLSQQRQKSHQQNQNNHQYQQPAPIQSIVSSSHESASGYHNSNYGSSPISNKPNALNQNENNSRQLKHLSSSSSQQTKFDDIQEIGSPHSQNSLAIIQSDGLDSASGTDPTPTQIRLNHQYQRQRLREPYPTTITTTSTSDYGFNSNKLIIPPVSNNNGLDHLEPKSASSALPSSSGNDVDANLNDMHTTRSSMGLYVNNNRHSNNLDNQALDLGDHQVIMLKQAHPNQLKPGTNNNQASVLDDPDDQLIQSQFGHANPSQNNNHQRQMMTLGNNSSTQQLNQQLNSALMTNLLSNMNQNDHGVNELNYQSAGSTTSNQQLNSPINQQHQGFRGGFSGSLPISMLFNDILKLARPFQQQQDQNQNTNRVNSQHQQQQPQVGGGILQQLRSLPSPFLSLLQSLSPTGSSPSSSPSQTNSINNNNNGNQFNIPNEQQALMNQFMMANNDASESNQHYHKLLPSDINAILARSLRSASEQPVLPGFSAPKGYSEKRWTQGGSADNYQSSMNANADFVANNAAGFVRQQHEQSPQQSATASKPEQVVTPPPSANNQATHDRSSSSGSSSHSSPSVTLGINGNSRSPPTIPNTNTLPLSNILTSDLQHQNNQYLWNQPQHPNPHHHHQQPVSIDIDSNSVVSGSSTLALDPTKQLHPQMIPNTNNNDNNNNNNNQPPIYLSGPVALGANQNQQHITGVPNYHNLQSVNQHQIQDLSQNQQIALGFNNQYAVASGPLQALQNHRHQHYKQMISPMLMDGSKPKPSNTLAPQSVHHQQLTIVKSFDNGVPIDGNPVSQANSAALISVKQPNNSQRRKRSISFQGNDIINYHLRPLRERFARRADYSAEENDEDIDDLHLSVVKPDGLPMAPSDESTVRHVLADKSKQFKIHPGYQYDGKHDDRFADGIVDEIHNQQQPQLETASSGLMSKLLLGTASTNDELEDELDDDDDLPSEKRKEEIEDAEFGIVTNKARRRKKNNDLSNLKKNKKSSSTSTEKLYNKNSNSSKKKSSVLINQARNRQSAYPLLTGNVIGDDQARPRNRNELIGNTNNNDITSSNKLSSNDNNIHDQNDINSNKNNNQQHQPTGEADDSSPTYAKRQQQRSDVEFYGHPGEETRQLKYGILGSGNYEIVNGGVYVENDELTAAVNSVANYVRKPGSQLSHGSAAQSLALALPRLLKASGVAGSAAEALRLSGSGQQLLLNNDLNHEHRNYNALGERQQSALGGMSNGAREAPFKISPVAGGRLNAAGLLRDTSAILAADSEGPHEAGHSEGGLRDSQRGQGSKAAASGSYEENLREERLHRPHISTSSSLAVSPLLDLIYDSHNSIDSSLLSQLGTTTRTVHDTSVGVDNSNKPNDYNTSGEMSAKQQVENLIQEQEVSNRPNRDQQSTATNDLDDDKQISGFKKQQQELRGSKNKQRKVNSITGSNINHVSSTTELETEEASRLKGESNTNNIKEEIASTRGLAKSETLSKSGSKDKHQNDQFNSYVILPSKKVTIFSDRDLDSAPSELESGARENRFGPGRQAMIYNNEKSIKIDNYNRPTESLHRDQHHEPYRSIS